MTTRFPSVPDPGRTPDTLLATILAMRDVVRLLVKDAQDKGSDTAYATTSYVNKHIATALGSGGVVTQRGFAFSTSTLAKVTLSLAVPCDVLAMASFIGPQVPIVTAGVGRLWVNDGTGDYRIMYIPVAEGNALPVSGARLFSAVASGTRTFQARAEFTGPLTELNNISLILIAFAR